jgi:hypothetical protein
MRPDRGQADDNVGNRARTALFVIVIIAAATSVTAAIAWHSPAYQYLSCASCHM